MRSTRRLAPLALTLLLFPGCATAYSFTKPRMRGKPFGGMRIYFDGSRSDPYGVGIVGWLLALPFTVPDTFLSLGADLALLPVTGGYAALRGFADWLEAPPAPPPPPPPPPPEPPRKLTLEEVRAQEVQWALKLPCASRADALRRIAAIELLDRSILRTEDEFFWLPEGPVQTPGQLGPLADIAEAQPEAEQGLLYGAHIAEREGRTELAIARCDRALDLDPVSGPAWTIRGWARLRDGDLEGAEGDLRVGHALCLLPMNRAWASAGLGRVREASGDAQGALDQYRAALADLRPPPPGVADASQDIRRRAEALDAPR